MPEPFTFSDAVLHFDGAGPIRRSSNEPNLWNDKRRPEFQTGQVLSVFSYATTWDYQERHPDGDELAVVLEGDIEFLIDSGYGETPVRLRRGDACIVPTDAWHRVAVIKPSTILFITPIPARTEHRHVVDSHAKPASMVR